MVTLEVLWLPHIADYIQVAAIAVRGVFRAKLADGPFAMPLFKFAADVHTLSRRAELQSVTQDCRLITPMTIAPPSRIPDPHSLLSNIVTL